VQAVRTHSADQRADFDLEDHIDFLAGGRETAVVVTVAAAATASVVFCNTNNGFHNFILLFVCFFVFLDFKLFFVADMLSGECAASYAAFANDRSAVSAVDGLIRRTEAMTAHRATIAAPSDRL
jgi:hypothetical protein